MELEGARLYSTIRNTTKQKLRKSSGGTQDKEEWFGQWKRDGHETCVEENKVPTSEYEERKAWKVDILFQIIWMKKKKFLLDLINTGLSERMYCFFYTLWVSHALYSSDFRNKNPIKYLKTRWNISNFSREINMVGKVMIFA